KQNAPCWISFFILNSAFLISFTLGRRGVPPIPPIAAECRLSCRGHPEASQLDLRVARWAGRASPRAGLLAFRGFGSGIHALQGRGSCCLWRRSAEAHSVTADPSGRPPPSGFLVRFRAQVNEQISFGVVQESNL